MGALTWKLCKLQTTVVESHAASIPLKRIVAFQPLVSFLPHPSTFHDF